MTTFREDAAHMVKLNAIPYKRVSTIYGGHIDKYKAEAPRSLCLAHILRTNPQLAVLPEGVMRVDIAYAKDFDVPKKNLIKDIASVYVFCRSLNREAQLLYTSNTSLFSSPYTDLWKCAYLKIALRPRSFDTLWSLAAPRSSAYETLLTYVESMRQSIIDWPIRKLRRFVLYDVDFAVQLAASQGPLVSSGTGIEPIPPADHYDIIYGEG
jgi:hypothetical protein